MHKNEKEKGIVYGQKLMQILLIRQGYYLFNAHVSEVCQEVLGQQEVTKFNGNNSKKEKKRKFT